MAKQIVRQAPYLRRFARALTGSQASGDALVQNAMEALLAGQIQLAPALPLRTGLFRALYEATKQVALPAQGETRDPSPDQHLQGLSPEQRASLLLTSMEAFSLSEAAQILGVPTERVEAQLVAADGALGRQLATDVLIIEDEPIIGLDLTRLAREAGHRVTGVAATRDEAVTLAQQTQPGLVLADIRLADGSSGMDAAAEILESFDIPVIFITAFPEHLLTGERPEPAFLITKPFREEAVKALIAQALFFHRPQRELTSA